MSKKVTEQEKPKTKYDRKMEARRKAAEKEKREKLTLRIVGFALLAALVGTSAYFGVTRFVDVHTATTEPYVSIGDHQLTQLEYEYYYNTSVSNYISSYSYFLSYMGLDTEKPLDEQQYSETMTWKDYFEQTTCEQLRQEYALIDDAKANGFEYDTTEDYNNYLTTAKETAKNANQTLAQYFKASFGDYATVSNVKPFMEQSYYARAYYDKLLEDHTPDDATVATYYEAHKADYDKVSYYSFAFDPSVYASDTALPDATEVTGSDENTPGSTTEAADTTTDANSSSEDADSTTEATSSTEDANSTTETNNSTEDTDSTTETADNTTDATDNTTATNEESPAYILANEMLERLKDGEDFETLCAEFATDDTKSNYESTDSEYSLTENVTCSSANADFSAWLSDESRKEGDMTVIQSESTGVCYVLKFVSRTYDDTCLDSISSTLSSDEVGTYIDALLENAYEVTDLKGNLNYLSTTEASSTDSEADTEATTEDTTEAN